MSLNGNNKLFILNDIDYIIYGENANKKTRYIEFKNNNNNSYISIYFQG